MKTRDRILTASLALFNEEGASGLSAVDIAAALGISPGHLYYHFKGKAEIVSTLFSAYEAELALVLDGAVAALAAPDADLATMETQLRILLEETHDMRFLFRETGALVAAFPDLAPRFRRVMSAQYGCVVDMLAALSARTATRARRAVTIVRRPRSPGSPVKPSTSTSAARCVMPSFVKDRGRRFVYYRRTLKLKSTRPLFGRPPSLPSTSPSLWRCEAIWPRPRRWFWPCRISSRRPTLATS